MRISLLPPLLLLAACSPSLRQAESFTPKRVNEVVFDDTCRLQGYFDGNPSLPRPQSETSVSGSRDGATVGRVTFHIAQGGGRSALRRLLARHYRRLPPLQGEMRVTVRFYASGGSRQMPIGAGSQLEVGGKEVSLPYHPCLGFFFFGQEHYAMRRRLLSQSSL